MRKYPRILIDVSGMYFRAYMTSQHLVSDVEGKRMVTGGIFTSIKMIQRIEREYLDVDGRIYFLFDNALSGEDRRKDIDPGYKINRRKRDPQFYRGLDYLQLVLLHYATGYRIVRCPSLEADDLVAPILESFKDNNYSTLLVSNDMDWSRAINDSTHWMTRKNSQDIIYTKQKFYEDYGFYPGLNEVCLYKAIRGDVSDNIPAGIKNIPENIVLDVINQAKSVDNMFLYFNDLNIPSQWKDEIRQNKGRIYLNLRLVNYQPLSVATCREHTTISEFNESMLNMFYRILNFKPEVIDERLRGSDTPIKEEDFFKDYDIYPRVE